MKKEAIRSVFEESPPVTRHNQVLQKITKPKEGRRQRNLKSKLGDLADLERL